MAEKISPERHPTPHHARPVLKNTLERIRRPSSRWRGQHSAALAACTAVWLAAPPLAGAQTLQKALDVRTHANETSAASQDRINQVADQTDDLLRQYREELQQIEALRVYNAQLEKLLASQEEEAGSLREQIENVTVIGREVTPLMLRMVDSLEEFVALDVPFLLEERRERVAKLKALMDRADVTNAEKYRRILEAYQIENDFGRTIEAYRGSLEAAGATRTVDYLRVGRVALLYQTLDGNEIGTWNEAGGNWQTLDGNYRAAIRQGLRIARKQAAPDLLRLPVPAAEDAR
jgi:DNA repair exonuclease SbcCD ATPase subunit